MRPIPLRRLLLGQKPSSDRIFFSGIWFRGHNNPRYAELLPRLDRLDAHLPLCSDQRIVRGIQSRALQWSTEARYRIMFPAVRRRYRSLFAIDLRQVAHFDGPVVADIDDPKFDERTVALLDRPNVAAYVVVNERLGARYEALGVRKPWHVIPQGVSLGSIDPSTVTEVAARHRANGELVVGYMAAWLLSDRDRGGDNPLFNIDHLFELWDEIRARVPHARLWLLGGASKRVRQRCQGRDDIVLFGRVPREEVLAYASNFDIALYPRTVDQGFQAAKIAEYMGCGVPTVSYDYAVTADLRGAGAGLLAATPREFVAAVARLASDRQLRGEVAAAAGTAGAGRDWDSLAGDYAAILDRCL